MADTDAPPTAADALAIIEREQARTSAGLVPNLALMFGVWGAAWTLIGVGYWLLRTGRLDLPGWAIAAALAVTVLTAAAVSTAASVRSSRGLQSATEGQAIMLGFSWPVAFVGGGLLLWGLERVGLTPELEAVLYPGVLVLLAGVLFLAFGAHFRDRSQYALGLWTVAVAVASVHTGDPNSYLVMALGGGGGLLALAVHHLRAGRSG